MRSTVAEYNFREKMETFNSRIVKTQRRLRDFLFSNNLRRELLRNYLIKEVGDFLGK
jgi:hypothetical protein